MKRKYEYDISFLFVNYNMSGLLYKCIKSINDNIESLSYEIIIGDNSIDRKYMINLDDIESKHKEVYYFENKGWVDAINNIIPYAKGKYVFISHPDIIFNEKSISYLYEFHENNAKAGIIGPNLYYPNGIPCKIRLKFPTIYSETKRLINVIMRGIIHKDIIKDEINWDRKTDFTETDTIMSVCMMVKHNVLSDIGKIPSNYWTYYSNDYICYISRKLGYRCYYIKMSNVIHYERFSDINKFSNKTELKYKLSPLPIEEKMQKDRFAFLRIYTGSECKVYIYKLLSILEYLLLYISAIIKKDNNSQRELRNIIVGILHY